MSAFEQLCVYGKAYVLNQVKEHPFWKHIDKHNLYELDNDELRYIIDHIAYYNECGFFTNMSQPDERCKYHPFKNAHSREIIDEEYVSVQHAYVSGYMERSAAERLYNILSLDNNIFIEILYKDGKRHSSVQSNRKRTHISYSYKETDGVMVKCIPTSIDVEPFTNLTFFVTPLPHWLKEYDRIGLSGSAAADMDICGISIMDVRDDGNNSLWSIVRDALSNGQQQH